MLAQIQRSQYIGPMVAGHNRITDQRMQMELVQENNITIVRKYHLATYHTFQNIHFHSHISSNFCHFTYLSHFMHFITLFQHILSYPITLYIITLDALCHHNHWTTLNSFLAYALTSG